MEAQLQRPTHERHQDEDDPHSNAGLHSVIESEGAGEHNHNEEKKSVLKKVKDKAKKIKDTIVKHGDHGHEHDYRHDQISEDDDDKDEETVNALEVHGAPMYESAFISGTNLPKQTGLDLEKPTGPLRNEEYTDVGDSRGGTRTSGMPEDRYNPNVTNEVYPDVGDSHGATRASALLDNRYNLHARNEVYSGVGDDRRATRDSGLLDDRHDPNVRSEVSPDIGDGGLTKTSGLRKDRRNPNVRDEVHPDAGVGSGRVLSMTSGPGKTGTESGWSPVQAPQPELVSSLQTGRDAIDSKDASVTEPNVKIGPLVDLVEDPHSPKDHPGEIPLSNYQTKVVDPTGHGGKEAEIDPLIRRLDNLHVRDQSESSSGSEQRSYTGSHDQFAPQLTPTRDQFCPESSPIGTSSYQELPRSFDSANPESMPRGTVTGKISAATSAVADKAVSARNAVASKLGYGTHHQEGQDSSKVTEYGYKVAEKLAPVYEKVAGAGSAIMSKVQRGGAAEHGSGDTIAKETDKGESGDTMEKETDKGVSVREYLSGAGSVITSKVQRGGGAEHEGGDTVARETDKGVSVKEYLSEKFSPGDEDKALSEVITDAIRKKKEGVRRPREDQPIEHLKEPERTVAYSGTSNESESEAVAAGRETSGVGVVDRVKGAVSSWLGKSSGTETGQHSLGQEHGSTPSRGGSLGKEESGN